MPKSGYDIPSAIEEMWELRNTGAEPPKLVDLGVMLRKLVASNTSLQYYIVIDAVDESMPEPSERESFLGAINDLLSSGSSPVHVYMASRPQEDIKNQLNELVSLKRIDLEVQSGQDISSHIADQLKHDRVLNKWPKKEHKRIKETLLSKAGGM
jgi:C-terminal processing protease CtpA/Prc